MKKQLPDFSNYSVLVIGDVMLDQYIYGSVDRISPEAPVPVMLREQTRLMAGGAANVALNIKALGAQPVLVGSIGNDLSGDRLIEVLENQGINTQYINRSNSETTTVKTRLLAGSQHLLRIDEEDISDLDLTVKENIIQMTTDIVEHLPVQGILVEDYDKGLMSIEMIRHLEFLAEERQLFLAVDPKNKHFLDYQRFDLFKPNLREVNMALASDYTANLTDLHRAAKALYEQLEYKNLMITLGEHGIFGMQKGEYFHEEAQKLDIVDVCGAGDAVISTATLCLMAGMSLKEAMHLSNLAGAEVCRHPGVVAVNRKALER